MANGYNKYSYARALHFFEAYYPYDTEQTHYDEILLSLNDCNSIEEMLPICRCLKSKINALNKNSLEHLPDKICKELSQCSPKVLTWNEHGFKRLKSSLKQDVNSCYDENVIRLFKAKGAFNEQTCGECLLELSSCESIQKKSIIDIAKEQVGIDVSELLNTISKKIKSFHTHLAELGHFKEEMNGYFQARKKVSDDLKFLMQYKWKHANHYRKYLLEENNEELFKSSLIKEKTNAGLKGKGEAGNNEEKNDSPPMWLIIIGIIIVGGGLGYLISIPQVGNWILLLILLFIFFKMMLS